MKRIVLSALALSILAAPVYAESRYDGRNDHRVEKRVIVKKKVIKKRRHWSRGSRLDRHERRMVVNDYRRYRLSKPPRGQQWVKVDNDYLLIGIATGVIASIVQGN